jgi:uncharacterized protein
MRIVELTTAASLEFLGRIRLGRLGCAQGDQPYVVPFYFACCDRQIYGFSTLGQKIAWMRGNPLVCVEADEVIGSRDWISVVVSGRYQELQDTPELRGARELAHRLLQQNAMWWEPGYTRTILRGTERPLEPLFFRIHIDQVTGHRAVAETVAPAQAASAQGVRPAANRAGDAEAPR